MNLGQKIEGYLFYAGEPVGIKKLAQVFGVAEGSVRESLKELEVMLDGRGIVLMHNGDEVTLGTHPEMSDIIMHAKKEQLSDPLSKSALETLTIILYKDGATKPEIDFIRGVNSGFMLRNLMIRGLIEKIPNPDDKRVTKYRATFDTLRFLGVSKISDLPNFETFRSEMEKRHEQGEKKEENIFTS